MPSFEKIAAVAVEVINSDAAKELAAQTGALIYWQDEAASTAQIEKDATTLGTVLDLIDN